MYVRATTRSQRGGIGEGWIIEQVGPCIINRVMMYLGLPVQGCARWLHGNYGSLEKRPGRIDKLLGFLSEILQGNDCWLKGMCLYDLVELCPGWRLDELIGVCTKERGSNEGYSKKRETDIKRMCSSGPRRRGSRQILRQERAGGEGRVLMKRLEMREGDRSAQT
jgi:hypothetical protein